MNAAQDVQTISDRLLAYLRAELGSPDLDYATPLTQLHGGFETSIYRFELAGTDQLSTPLVLRLYPQFYGTGNAIWESTLQNGLAAQGYPVAKAHMLCTDMTVLDGAFFIMDHVPGRPLAFAPHESVPELLGTTHAKLHDNDPAPLVKMLSEKGINNGYRLENRLDSLKGKAKTFPWLQKVIDWLLQHRPPEPEQLSVCHGDFHPLNIMYADGQVTGVLDWGGFSIADPAYDIGSTIVLINVAFKHLAASMEGIAAVDYDLMVERYLDAYRAHRDLDNTYLDYYTIRRCVFSLVQGAEGQQVWQHPLIVRDLLENIRDVTGIQIAMPATSNP